MSLVEAPSNAHEAAYHDNNVTGRSSNDQVAGVPVHDNSVIQKAVSLGAEPANICCASAHDYQPQPHACITIPACSDWLHRPGTCAIM